MSEKSQPRIQIAAAQLAVTLKQMFGSELRKAAGELATSGEALTADHYRRAVSIATAKLLQFVDVTEFEDARRAA